MSPWLDQLLVAVAIVGAAGYLLMRQRARSKSKACGGDCCTSNPKPGVPKAGK